jgi:CheY-like chemotaxis protein
MILLVEDEPRSRRVFSQILRESGYQVQEAGDGNEALGLLGERVFDLVITDLCLPDMDGLNIINFLSARCPKTPLVVISGYISQDAGSIILEGTAAYIQKPIRGEALIEIVQRLAPKSN